MTTPLNIKGDLQGQVTLTPEEHPDDRAARLRTEARRELIHDCKEAILFGLLSCGVVLVGVVAAYEGVWDMNTAPETKRWAQTVLSALMTGGISFVVGRRIGGK